MPKLKRRAQAANLGEHAKKKQKLSSASGTSPSPDVSRSASPADLDEQMSDSGADSASQHSRESHTDSDDSFLSEDLHDMPKFESEAGLLGWLDIGKTQLKKILARLKQPAIVKNKPRGPYYKSTLGAAPAERTVRLHKATAVKTTKAHGGGLDSWFRAPTASKQAVAAVAEPSASTSMGPVDPRVPPFPSRRPVTIEEVPDEELDLGPRPESPTPSELSRLDEDGLGPLEEIFASLDCQNSVSTSTPTLSAASSPPSNSTRPIPTLPPNPTHPSVHFGPPPFTRADDTFSHIPVKPRPPPNAPPPPAAIDEAIKKIKEILRPSRGPNTKGYKHADLNMVLRYSEWAKHADIIAKSAGSSSWMSRRIREWTITFMKDDTNLPTAEYGKFNGSVLEDEDLAQEIHLHLQSVGKFVAAQDIVNYMASDEMKTRFNLKHGISLRTAQRWMRRMEYRWKSEPKGMYSDGHEREDVVAYRQNVFLPRWESYLAGTRKWTREGEDVAAEGPARDPASAPKKSKQRLEEEQWEEWEEEAERIFVSRPDGKVIVIWRHDECIFYANDRRKLCWVHLSETAKPWTKGEGASMMVIAFVSPDYGWELRMVIKPGKDRDGYYTNLDILNHATRMMDRLDATRPNEIHVLAYDNATIHTKRADDALSLQRDPTVSWMPIEKAFPATKQFGQGNGIGATGSFPRTSGHYLPDLDPKKTRS
ncbi:hypothetical protein B0H11DRAFT_2335656 [Mycena galericulata]|nr:hypothetical protein B0H11DRAFT_2335656 [Mycena galericulata]